MDISKYKGTKTEENLRTALAGESVVRNKYTYYAMTARRAGLDDAANLLERLAKNEMMHAKFWFEALNGPCPNTADNLIEASRGEYGEWHGMYPEFAVQARADGFEDLAVMFDKVAAIERQHEKELLTLCAKLPVQKPEGNAPQADVPTVSTGKKEKFGYRCVFCGAIFSRQPDVCSVCRAIGACEPYTYEE